jgi:D-galactarolactone cycloisomerase
MMRRRDLLKSLPVLAASGLRMPSLFAQAKPRMKITDVRLAKVKLVQDLGTYTNAFHTPARPVPVRTGGFSITEIYTDQNVVGIGPSIPAEMVATAKAILVGQDPFDIENHARWLYIQGRWGAQVEIALWDLVGKATNQPLYKLWGGGKDKVMPYGATMGLGDGPAERARVAAQVKADGFRAVKMRSSYPTMKEDIQLMEQSRKAVGDDFLLLVDANKAGPYGNSQLVTVWDYRRALETALEFQKLNVYWLEEPLGRFDYEGLAELNRSLDMKLAGGEANTRLDEYRTYLEKGCYDILNCDVGVLGPTLYRQSVDLAFAMDRRVVPHAGTTVLAEFCAIHLAASHPQLPYGNLDTAPHFELEHNPPLQDFRKMWSVFQNPPDLDGNGFIPLPNEPGLGVTIKPELIDRS